MPDVASPPLGRRLLAVGGIGGVLLASFANPAVTVTHYPDAPQAADAVVVPHEARPVPAVERNTR